MTLLFIGGIFSILTHAESIKELNKVRENYFEKNLPFDSIFVTNIIKSNDLNISYYAKGILGLYFIQNSNPNGDIIWEDIVLEKKILSNKNNISEDMLLIDDLFRVCMSLNKYYYFFDISTMLSLNRYKMPFEIYNEYIALQTGNYYNYFFFGNYLKNRIIDEIDDLKDSTSSKVVERMLFNITSINFSNFDTIFENEFYNKINKYYNPKTNPSNSYESLIFNYTFSIYKNKELKEINKIGIDIQHKVTLPTYIPPFINKVIFNQVPLVKETRDYLVAYSQEYYSNNINLFINNERYTNDVLEWKIKSDSIFIAAGRLSPEYTSFTNSITHDYEKQINKIEDILIKSNYKPEPNWIKIKWDMVKNIGNNLNSARIIINNKYKDSLINWETKANAQLYFYLSESDRIYKINDETKCIDNINVFHSINSVYNYILKNRDEEILIDTNINQKIDSFIVLVNHLNNIKYFSNGSITIEKRYLYFRLIDYSDLFSHILYIKKNFIEFEKMQQIIDELLVMNDIEKISKQRKIINVAISRERYLSFKNVSSKEKINEFDSTFVNYFKEEVIRKYTPGFNYNYNLFKSTSREILIDIKHRNNIDDSTLSVYLSFIELINSMLQEGGIIFDLNFKGNDSTYLISTYKNNFFCIDDSKIKKIPTKKIVEIQASIKKLFKGNVDSTGGNILWYFISESFEKRDPSKETYKEIATSKDLTLYAMYARYKMRPIIKKIASLDTLKSHFDYSKAQGDIFISKKYLQQLENSYSDLYSILLAPFDTLISSKRVLKVVMPNNLVSIPLDLIYAKKKNEFPHFIEYGSLYKSAIVNDLTTYDLNDSAAIFSEMTYNNLYCNVNKKNNNETRSSILPLLNSIKERIKVENLIKSKTYTGIYASKETFINSLLENKYSIIHLITHGKYIPNFNFGIDNNNISQLSRNTSIELKNPLERQILIFSSDSTNKLSSNNNILTAVEIAYLEDLTKIKLIFLSACETGMIESDETQKSGYSGFINFFLERGANAVIATRWQVSDDYSSEFAGEYYKNLVSTRDYEKAFYNTKKTYFEKKSPAYLWASYLFVR